MTDIASTYGIRCAACKSRHGTVGEVRDCHDRNYSWNACSDPELEDGSDAYVRHLENAGWAEIELERQVEAQRGVIDFSAAWDLADPSRVARREADLQSL